MASSGYTTLQLYHSETPGVQPSAGDLIAVGWQNDMIAYLVGAIKELKTEIDALKAAK